jgi:hypothetical protein
MYNKLFTKILDSTIWLENDATRLVWITFLAVMDEDGFVALSASGFLDRGPVALDMVFLPGHRLVPQSSAVCSEIEAGR